MQISCPTGCRWLRGCCSCLVALAGRRHGARSACRVQPSRPCTPSSPFVWCCSPTKVRRGREAAWGRAARRVRAQAAAAAQQQRSPTRPAVHLSCAGTASQFVLMRAAGAVVGGAAGLLCGYLTWWANGSSYRPSATKGAGGAGAGQLGEARQQQASAGALKPCLALPHPPPPSSHGHPAVPAILPILASPLPLPPLLVCVHRGHLQARLRARWGKGAEAWAPAGRLLPPLLLLPRGLDEIQLETRRPLPCPPWKPALPCPPPSCLQHADGGSQPFPPGLCGAPSPVLLVRACLCL